LSFQDAKAQVIRRFERTYLERQLRACSGNVSRAARASGKQRRAFFELVRKHNIDVEQFRH
jgi:two-component system response regulator GlrR